jgi:hypothetical protein
MCLAPIVRPASKGQALAPSGLIRDLGITQGEPWAMLFWPLRVKEWNRPNCIGLSDAENTRARMSLALVLRPGGPAPTGQERLAQGLPWVSRCRRFALKGREMRPRSGAKVRSRFWPYPVAPSGLIPDLGISQGKPWAMLFWPLRAKEWNRPNCLTLKIQELACVWRQSYGHFGPRS